MYQETKDRLKSDDAPHLAELTDIYEWMLAGNSDDINNFKKYMGYYTGTEQWTDEERMELEDQGRPPLALNIIFPKINVVTGIEQQTRSGYRAIPVGIEDEQIATLCTALLKFEDSNRRLQKIFSRAFKTAAICGRSWIDCTVAREQGEYVLSNKIKVESPFNVLKDPDGREVDMSDWNYLARQKWLNLSQLRMIYPDVFKGKDDYEIMAMLNFSPPQDLPRQWVEYADDYPTNPNIANWTTYIDEDKKRAKVIELYKKTTVMKDFVLEVESGLIYEAESEKDAEKQIKNLEKIQSTHTDAGVIPKTYQKIKLPSKKITVDVYSGNMIFRREEDLPFRYNDFPLVPITAYMEDTGKKIETFGLVKNLIDPQDEKNKRHSQFTDILNRAPKGGGFYQQSSIDPEQIQNLSKAGSWIGIRGNIKDKIQPATANYIPILSHYQWLEQLSMTDAKEISGINDSLVGVPTNSRESGIAAQTRIAQGMTSLQEIFDNLNTSKKMVLTRVLSNIQQFYDISKIMRCVGVYNSQNPNEAAEASQELIQKFNNLKYDIVLDEGENSPTARIAFAQTAKELLQYGGAMPPEAVMTLVKSVIDMANFPNKDQLLDQLNSQDQMQQLMQMMAEEGGAEVPDVGGSA